MRNYPRLPIVDFGRHLLETNDLDPIYEALVRANFGAVGLRRWCLAYWTFYSAATASYIAEAETAEGYWERFKAAAICVEPDPVGGPWPTPTGKRWPRGHERRHMRGQNAVNCYMDLRARYPLDPERFLDYCVPGPTTCKAVMKRVQEHTQFGPWIGFKVADMTERVLGIPVDFTEAEVFMFKDPKEAALLFYKDGLGRFYKKGRRKNSEEAIQLAVNWLKTSLGHLPAPPGHDRPVGIQEVETVLCKWKSHMNGHYPENNDTIEIREGLKPWLPHSEYARRFLDAMPEVTPWT